MSAPSLPPPAPRALRLWPGVLLVTLQWIVRFVVPLILPDTMMFAILGGIGLGLGVVLWWAFFSRLPHLERWGGILLIIAVAVATRPFLHPSIATGMMGFLFPIYLLPVLSLALVLWAVLSRRLPPLARRAGLVLAVLAACAGFTTLRTEGITGEGQSEFAWRWTQTREQQMLAAVTLPAPAVPVVPAATTAAAIARTEPVTLSSPSPLPAIREFVEPQWPGFRGRGRDGIVPGVRIDTDWSDRKPVEIWRKPVGPGWSSFAIAGDLLYTQEQHGDEEVVACYDAATGDPVWAHRDRERFWESNAGAGPRATPAVYADRVYSFGATGILNALDAATGARIWSRNVAADTGTEIPGWGFSSSPLVLGDLVVVAAGGRLAGYDRSNGAIRWQGPRSGGGYSSPHLFTAAGVVQVVLQTAQGVLGVDPSDGKLLWKHEWPPNAPIVQPARFDGELLVSSGQGAGMQRIGIVRTGGEWKVEPRWTSQSLKPYFNDFVIHDQYVYGFDNAILACIDANDGERKWKGGRYGHGQMVVLRQQALLLVLSEEGELALVRAIPDGFTELARIPVLEGKTWNHLAVAGERLFVRNGSEMVALRLPLEKP